jgi:hypothetical protein
VGKRLPSGLTLCIDGETHWSELHVEDGVVAVAALRGRGEANDVLRLHLGQLHRITFPADVPLHPVPSIAEEFRTRVPRFIDPVPLCPVRQGVVLFLLPDRLLEFKRRRPRPSPDGSVAHCRPDAP